jgi:LysM domain
MYRFLLVALAVTLFLNQPISAEEDRNGIIDDHNKTSSSFVVDPDPLDPLPVKKENIKDGDEIILEDIRQVIDSKPKKEVNSNGVSPSHGSTTKKTKSSKSTRKSKKTKSNTSFENLNPDDPDTKLEDRLHSTYQKFNITPTSPEQWAQATQAQKENIYVVQKNDTLFTISKTLFGDSKFWPKIWAINRADILNPHQIKPGMQIRFFAGNSDNVPTVSIDPKGFDPKSVDPDKDLYFVQDTEFQKITITDDKKNKQGAPTAIPDSLPLTRNGKYYSQNDKKDQIDIKTFEYVDNVKHANPYILTSMDLKSDFIVEKEQIPYLMCKDAQFVPIVKKNNVDAVLPGKYFIVQPLSREGSQFKKTNKYKTIGDVTINEKEQMRVSSCRDLMNFESLIVSEEKIRALSEPDETFDFSARIVDGLEYPGQNYYADNQYLVINIGNLNVDTGADLNVFSDDLGKKVGSIRILRRTGTMAIAVVTHAFDVINSGDKITE